MISNLQAFHAAISAIAPIDGVSADGVTVWFKKTATPAQIAAATAAMASYIDTAVVGFQAPNPPMQALPRPKAITEL